MFITKRKLRKELKMERDRRQQIILKVALETGYEINIVPEKMVPFRVIPSRFEAERIEVTKVRSR